MSSTGLEIDKEKADAIFKVEVDNSAVKKIQLLMSHMAPSDRDIGDIAISNAAPPLAVAMKDEWVIRQIELMPAIVMGEDWNWNAI